MAAAYESNKSKRDGRKQSQQERNAWRLGFAAFVFASLGTTAGLWSLSGAIGRGFLIAGLVITVITAGLIIWRKQPAAEQRNKDPNSEHHKCG